MLYLPAAIQRLKHFQYGKMLQLWFGVTIVLSQTVVIYYEQILFSNRPRYRHEVSLPLCA
ncbi:hypothetical protein BZG06_15420 [Salinivibrio kushneri]|nr:hypothetical protein BZG06_15420 [Salinivibrio kushneri]